MLKLSKNNDCLLLRLMQTFFYIATTHLRSYLGLTPGNQPAGFPRKDLGHGRQKVAEITGAPNEYTVQNHLNIALLNVF